MAVRKRFIEILKAANFSQTDFANKSGYSRAALTNFINGRTSQPKADFFQAVKKAFPTLNLDWLITGQGDIWEGPPPKGLEALETPESKTPPHPDQELFNRLLVQKLEEIARELKVRDPEAYKKLRLDELIGKEKGR